MQAKNSGYLISPTFTTINLALADLKREGSGFDLPIADYAGGQRGRGGFVEGVNVYPVASRSTCSICGTAR